MDSLSYIIKRGKEIEAVFDDLASLRIAVFRDYPYLYEGSIEYEKKYLKIYAKSQRSFLFAVYNGEQMVGATTCIPLEDETEEFRRPLEQAGYNVNTIFYFGESILLREFRGRGLGHRFFDEREAHAGCFASYEKACFCSVERAENHPARPPGYRSNEEFWKKRGYQRKPSLKAHLQWPDLGEEVSTPKPLVYWMKNLK